MNGSERRKHPRFQVSVPVRLTLNEVVYAGMLKDVCRDAALVELPEALGLQSRVSLSLQLPGTGGPLQVDGKVVRVLPSANGATSDVAVLFTDLTPAAETRIEFFIALQPH
jgi:PilZ domain